jgi:hypothetical protein
MQEKKSLQTNIQTRKQVKSKTDIVSSEKPKLPAKEQKRLNEQFLDAVKEGKIEDVKRLLKAGASIESMDKQNKTALMWATLAKHIEQLDKAGLLPDYGHWHRDKIHNLKEISEELTKDLTEIYNQHAIDPQKAVQINSLLQELKKDLEIMLKLPTEDVNKKEANIINRIISSTQSLLKSVEIKEIAAEEVSKKYSFEEWGLRGKWMYLLVDGKSVEGAYYSSGNNKKIVIFHPGLPGDSVVLFEERFVGRLLSEGYDVFVARHNGLKSIDEIKYLNNNNLVTNSINLFHNKKRIDQKTPISGNPSDWFYEPQVAIDYFARQYSEITLVTHSFSGICAANSFIGLNKSSKSKIKKWILLSASIWKLGQDDLLDPARNLSFSGLRQYCDYFETIYNLSPKSNAGLLFEEIKQKLEIINKHITDSVPENMEVIGIYPENDSLVSPEIGINFIGKLKRGIVLRDGYLPQQGEEPHDFKHATAENLIRIIRMKTSNRFHVFGINKK